jgi:hypothetical protein
MSEQAVTVSDEVLEDAQEAFWDVIATAFPEVEAGDYPPDATLHFEQECRSAVNLWLGWNHPNSVAAFREAESAIAVMTGDVPTDEAAARRWLDAALAYHGVEFEGPEDDEDRVSLMTAFSWDHRAHDVIEWASAEQQRAYDAGIEAAFTIIGQQVEDPYGFVLDLRRCNHCGRLRFYDRKREDYRHLSPDAPDCFLIHKPA